MVAEPLDLTRTPHLQHPFALNERLAQIVEPWLEYRPDGELNPAQGMVRFALGKAHKTHGAIVALCARGYGEDAVILLRTLLELAMDIRYIAQDTGENRGQRWLDYDAVTRYEFARSATQSTLPQMEDVRQEIQSHSDIAQQIESEARRVQRLWGFWKYERRGELVSPGYWHGTSAKQIAKKIGWQLSYDLVYAQASLLTHTSARSANDYIRRVSRDDHVLLDAAPSEHYVETVLGTAALYLHGIAADWCEILKVPSSMRERLKEVEGELPKKSPPREEPELESQGKM